MHRKNSGAGGWWRHTSGIKSRQGIVGSSTPSGVTKKKKEDGSPDTKARQTARTVSQGNTGRYVEKTRFPHAQHTRKHTGGDMRPTSSAGTFFMFYFLQGFINVSIYEIAILL
ncbi:unnamed protein product, partial [Laminaria digitata]